MIDIEHMDKEAIYKIMLDLLYSINLGWFKQESNLMEVYSALNRSHELNIVLSQVNEDVGRYEAKKLRKTLDIQTVNIDSLIKVLQHSHWFVFENIEIKRITDKCFRMRTINCTTQMAAKKRGKTYYDCTSGANQAVREGFFAEINKSAKVKRIFAPPESVPGITSNNISCEWEITID